MCEKSVIFVCGVHGVGKSVASKVFSDALGIPSYSASELIRRVKSERLDSGKVVFSPDENQDILKCEVLNALKSSDSIVLDGHFVLIGSGGFYEISENLFKSLPIKIVCVIHEESLEISRRLKLRDGQSMSVNEIETFQKKEIERARYVSDLIGAKLFLVKSTDTVDLRKCISGLN